MLTIFSLTKIYWRRHNLVRYTNFQLFCNIWYSFYFWQQNIWSHYVILKFKSNLKWHKFNIFHGLLLCIFRVSLINFAKWPLYTSLGKAPFHMLLIPWFLYHNTCSQQGRGSYISFCHHAALFSLNRFHSRDTKSISRCKRTSFEDLSNHQASFPICVFLQTTDEEQ